VLGWVVGQKRKKYWISNWEAVGERERDKMSQTWNSNSFHYQIPPEYPSFDLLFPLFLSIDGTTVISKKPIHQWWASYANCSISIIQLTLHIFPLHVSGMELTLMANVNMLFSGLLAWLKSTWHMCWNPNSFLLFSSWLITFFPSHCYFFCHIEFLQS
jgi:hypothetical protein